MIPLYDRNPTRRFAFVNWGLIAACCAVFLWELSVGGNSGPKAYQAMLTRAGLVQARGQPAVGEAHVADQALGVVVQRDRELAQVAGETRALAQDLARGDVGLADDLARVGARLRAHLLGLFLGRGAQLGEVLATGGE